MLSKVTGLIAPLNKAVKSSLLRKYCEEIRSHRTIYVAPSVAKCSDLSATRQKPKIISSIMASTSKSSVGARAANSDDDEVCVLYNHKEERSKKAVEIVIDDDDDESPTQKVKSGSQHNSQSSQHLSSCASSNTAEDFIPLNTNVNRSVQGPGRVVETCTSNNYSSSSSELIINPIEVEARRAEIEQWRTWNYTNLGCGMLENRSVNRSRKLIFSVMSYNVLSQQLLVDHPSLYKYHDMRALSWEHRSQVLLKEFALANADILCLQEVQKSHLDSFYNRLEDLGYDGIYKQRTGGKVDGVAIYFKKSMFTLRDHTSVEFYQPGVPILDRDNVGLIVKLAFKKNPDKELVVATTHLLFNPKRHDIKLAQVQLLLAEVERLAYVRVDRYNTPVYRASVITGDFNFEPHSGPYQLLTSGMFQYEGMSRHSLKNVDDGSQLGRSLIPSNLEVTDTCQHYSALLQRHTRSSHRERSVKIKLYHSELNKYGSFKNYVSTMKSEGYVNNFTPRPHTKREGERKRHDSLPPHGFGTGQLSHHLNLRSVYKHGAYESQAGEVTTFHNRWTTVDYIFYGGKYSSAYDTIIESDLKLLSRLTLPKRGQLDKFGFIPNLGAPSDHFPLAAVFVLTD